MEVPLQQNSLQEEREALASFNPCFNGSSSSTRHRVRTYTRRRSFNPCFNGSSSSTKVEEANAKMEEGFNPCFNGSSSSTLSVRVGWTLK